MSDPQRASRRVRLTPASEIKPLPVQWLWRDRIPLGEVTLTPGRGGLGKSTFHAWLMAEITRGTLPGDRYGDPRPCVIAASEDSWQRTIVPRLIAADADLELVYRVDVVTEGDAELRLTLPEDCEDLAGVLRELRAAVLSVDPLMSTISGGLDTHKDREVRHALEPLAKLADETGCVVLGNAHFNKSTGSDPLSLVTGSAAFGNVARAALGFARDPEAEDGSCVISQIKNNLGKSDLPSLRYVVESAKVDTEQGPAEVGRFVLLGESSRSVGDILRDRSDEDDDRGERDAAADWIRHYLGDEANAGEAAAASVLKAGRAAGYAERTLQRARKRAGVETRKASFGRGWVWALDLHDIGSDLEGATKAPKAPASETLAPTAPSWRLGDDTETSVPEVPPVPQVPEVPERCAGCGHLIAPELRAPGRTSHPWCEQ